MAKANRRNIPLYVLLWFLYLILIAGTAFSAYRSIRKYQKLQATCVMPGNQDMYGLGIRLGVYMQIITTALVDIWGTPQQAASLSAGNLWFLIALFVALTTIIWSGDYFAAEGYLIISLGNGLTLIMLGGTIRLEPGKLKEGGLPSFARFAVWGMWKVYSSVFWWVSLERVKQESCSSYPVAWFLVTVRLLGGFRTFHKIVNIIEWVVWLMGVLPYLFGIALLAWYVRGVDTTQWHPTPGDRASRLAILIDYMFVPIGELHDIVFGNAFDGNVHKHRPGGLNSQEDRDMVRLRLSTHMSMRYSPNSANSRRNIDGLYEYMSFPKFFWYRTYAITVLTNLGIRNFPFLALWDLSVLVFTVLTIELTLLKNQVEGVYFLGSAGQLVSFVVGLGGSLTAIAQFYLDRRDARLEGRQRLLAPVVSVP